MKKEFNNTDKNIAKYAKGLTVLSKKGLTVFIVAGSVALGGSIGAATYFGIKTNKDNGMPGTDAYLSIVDKSLGHWIGDTLNPSDFEVKRIDNKGQETAVTSSDLKFNISTLESSGTQRVVITDKNTRAIGCINIHVLNDGEVNGDIFRNAFLNLNTKEYIDDVEIYEQGMMGLELNYRDTCYAKKDKDYYLRKNYAGRIQTDKFTGTIKTSGNDKYYNVLFSEHDEESIEWQPASYCSLQEPIIENKTLLRNQIYYYMSDCANKYYDAKFENSEYSFRVVLAAATTDIYNCVARFNKTNLEYLKATKVDENGNLLEEHVHTFNYENFAFPIEYKEQNYDSIVLDKPSEGTITVTAYEDQSHQTEVSNPLNADCITYFARANDQYEGPILNDEEITITKDSSNPLKVTYVIAPSALTKYNDIYMNAYLLHTSNYIKIK